MIDIPDKELKEVCKKYDIKLMVLFGSLVKNYCTEKSDIDLAIYVSNIRIIKDNKQLLLNEIGRIFKDREIDIVLLNYADPLIKFTIAREGRAIYEEEEGLFNEIKVRSVGEHNDARKFYLLDKMYIQQYIKGEHSHGHQRINPPQIDQINSILK